jgi:hypothetical protein|nr:MAG TPA: hypothetical protein [Caudoviricetes sp.]
MAPVGTLYIMQLDAFLHRKIMQDLRIQRVKVLMMLYTSNYFVKVRQKQLLDHTYSLSRDQAFDYMTEFNKRLSDKVGIKCTMDILLPTDDDNANIIIEHNGIIKKLMKEAEKLELDTDAIKAMMRDLLDELKDDIDLNILIFDVTQLLIKYNLFRLDAITEQEFKNSFVRMDSRNMEIKKLTLSDIKKVVEMIEDRYSYALYMTEEYG